MCLNPCFDGIWSASEEEYDQLSNQASVLILVLMEYGLRELLVPQQHPREYVVLILVLMEYGLRGVQSQEHETTETSLNPCFNGI